VTQSAGSPSCYDAVVKVLSLLTIMLTIPGLAGCGDSGRLLITLERPEVKSFDPLNDVRLSRFSLRVTQGTSQSDQETVRTEGAELRVGSVPVGESFDLRLAGKSGTGQMLGLGLLFDLKVEGDREVPVAFKFRKPIGFVAGKHGIEQLDTTASTDNTIHFEQPIAAPNAADVAAYPDGASILVVSEVELSAFRTFDRKKWATVPLRTPGTCVAVSPDNAYAVVCHDGGYVSIVDMNRLAENQLELRETPVGGKPTRVVFGTNRTLARVLVDGAVSGCGAQSRMVEVNVANATKGREVALGRPVADLAVDPRDGRVLLALPCETPGRLGRINGDQVQIAAQLPNGSYDLALTDQYIVALGTSQNPLYLEGEAVLVDLNKQAFSTQKKTFGLPGLAVLLGQAGAEGVVGWIPEIQDFTIYDLSVSPDGQRALALFRAAYSSTTSHQNCQYLASITAHGMLLLDLTVDQEVYSQFTSLEISQCSICGSDCTGILRTALQNAKMLATPEYTPKGVAMLFGGP